MGELKDKIKGKAKQIEGVLTNDKARQNQGEREMMKGAAKGVVNKARAAVRNVVGKAKNAAKRI